MKTSGAIHIGTSGWNYRDWRGRFYPEGLSPAKWLDYYQGQFETVEINYTFYHLPEMNVFQRWAEQAQGKFLFAVKANRYLTHQKKLKDVDESLQLLLNCVRKLGIHAGPILYQLPPHWRPNLDRLKQFCASLPSDLSHVMEFREPDWLSEETYQILREKNVALCIHDLIPSHPRIITAPFTYVRFHGTGARYSGDYGTKELSEWADWMAQQSAAGLEVYAYFNNDMAGHAIKNALELRSLVESDWQKHENSSRSPANKGKRDQHP